MNIKNRADIGSVFLCYIINVNISHIANETNKIDKQIIRLFLSILPCRELLLNFLQYGKPTIEAYTSNIAIIM